MANSSGQKSEESSDYPSSETVFTLESEKKETGREVKEGRRDCEKLGESIKKRRRPRLPPNTIHKKTEEKDKYWLRAFRKYMRSRYPKLRKSLSPADQQFWDFLLSHWGTPGKGNK